MDWLLHFIQQSVSFIVPLIILLGLLIFVHEMGHFLVAKFYKVKVEVFSLGFGKKVFQFQRGDTTYCVCLIPLGGYVKMFGDDPSVEVSEKQQEGSFLHKPVGQRIAIVLAGPLMNFFFAILLFFTIALVGEEMIKPVVGDVDQESHAWTQGFRPGDTIQSVNENPVTTWDEVNTYIEQAKNKELSFTVSRKNIDQPITLQATTVLIENPNILSSETQVGFIEGLGILSRSSQIGIPSKDSLVAQAGLQSFDEITAINDQPIKKYYELEAFFESYTQSDPLQIKYLRPLDQTSGTTEEMTTQMIIPENLVGRLSSEVLGFETSDLYIAHFTEESPAKAARLMYGDKIQAIDGKPLKSWTDLMTTVQSFDPGQTAFQLEVLREGQVIDIELTPTLMEQSDRTGGRQSKYALGIYGSLAQTPTAFTTVRTLNPLLALQKGVSETLYWTQMTCLSFLRLIQGTISHRSIGGPIMIGQIASRTFQMGLSHFLKIMAIISINLFIINMLPVPVLDGGHLVFFTLEALRGAPLSMRKMEIAQTVGIIILLGLMALAFFNDISRIFEG